MYLWVDTLFVHFFLLFLFWLFWVKDIKIEHRRERKNRSVYERPRDSPIFHILDICICWHGTHNLMCLHNFISFYQNVSVCTQIKEFKVREFEDRKRIETVRAHTCTRGNKWYTAYDVFVCMRKNDRVMRTRWEHSNNKERKNWKQNKINFIASFLGAFFLHLILVRVTKFRPALFCVCHTFDIYVVT